MIHDVRMIDSLDEFVRQKKNENLSDDEMYNLWIRETGTFVHDQETSQYLLQAIPLIKEAYNNEVFN